MREPEQGYADFIAHHFRPGSVYTLVGAGGKSTGMRKIADYLSRRGIRARMAATTRIGVEEFSAYPVATAHDDAELARCIMAPDPCMVISGGVSNDGHKHAGLDPARIERLAIPADLVLLVEGDGSRRKSMKAPTAREPVIPANTRAVFALMGASAFDESVEAVRCYNAEGVLALLGQAHAVFDAPALLSLAADARGCRKGVLPGMGFHILVNQGDLEQKQATARALLQDLRRAHDIAGTLLSWWNERVYETSGE
jgi:probable selenium-dependent hydroxylase accessory protein YqeC